MELAKDQQALRRSWYSPPHSQSFTKLKLTLSSVKNNRQSLYYFFEASALRRQNVECLWSREGCYTWNQTSARANQYAHWYLDQGVKPNDYVAFYMMNSPDFIFAWLGLWAIGAAPAMINYNLAGKALLHCLKLSGAKLILVGSEPDLAGRILDSLNGIEGELGMTVCVMDEVTKGEIRSASEERIEDAYREGVRGNWAMAMFYTRYVLNLSSAVEGVPDRHSGTTGMPKGVPFNIDRGFQVGATVSILILSSFSLSLN